jgi:hypothetical protein
MGKDYVRVLGRHYEIKQEALEDKAGQCDLQAGIVSIVPNSSPFDLRDTVLHEIMHAILYQQGYCHPYELEESFVRPLSSGIMAVLQDNPKLAKWLIQPIKG